nr:MAG TPA: hypothetical protein [Caudoviricetes sp.]
MKIYERRCLWLIKKLRKEWHLLPLKFFVIKEQALLPNPLPVLLYHKHQVRKNNCYFCCITHWF